MTAAFQGLSRPGSSSTTLLAAVAELVVGSCALQQEAAPQAVHKAFTQVTLCWLSVVDCVVLGWIGLNPVEDPYA